MDLTSLSVLVPVFNEQHLVEESLRRLFILEESPHLSKVQVIVVDDGSTDYTNEILKKLSEEFKGRNGKFEWIFINHPKNLGKGKAIQSALDKATSEISIIHDADLEYQPKDIMRMVAVFIKEDADAVYGSRFTAYEYRRVLMFRHELGNRLLTFMSNMITNLNLTDVETCYKAVKTDFLKSIPIRSNDFRLEPELTIKLAKRNAKIFEVPISYSGRTYQEGKKIGWVDGLKALWAILKFGLSDDIFAEDDAGIKILYRLSKANKFNAWMTDKIRPYVGQNVLEIGAGIGNITKEILPRQNYSATDINPDCLQIIKSFQFNKPYLSVAYLDLKDVTNFSDHGKVFDTIICLNVIEHLDEDEQAARNIAKLLEENGRAIVLVPRGQWLFGSLDKVLGHKRRYSEKMLRNLAGRAGLSVKKIIQFNRISTIPWFVNGKIFKKRTFSRFQIFMMNLFTPIFRRIDKFLPFPSLSYITILEKKE